MNFLESLTHYSLYLKKIYPENFFTIRSVFGLQIKVAKDGILSDYIHKMIEDLKPLLNSVRTIRLNFMQDNRIKDSMEVVVDKSRILEKMDSLPS